MPFEIPPLDPKTDIDTQRIEAPRPGDDIGAALRVSYPREIWLPKEMRELLQRLLPNGDTRST